MTPAELRERALPQVARSALVCRPIQWRAARAWMRNHKHLSPPAGWLFGVAVYAGDALACVAMLGRPVARRLDNGLTAEVTRVATAKHDPVEHAAGKALAAISRAALALGYTRLVSYTRADEKGTTYRAAGWRPTEITDGGEWSVPSRARRPAEQPCRKVRWEYGPGAAPGIDVALPLPAAECWPRGAQRSLFAAEAA